MSAQVTGMSHERNLFPVTDSGTICDIGGHIPGEAPWKFTRRPEATVSTHSRNPLRVFRNGSGQRTAATARASSGTMIGRRCAVTCQ
mgnify:CR=1 FL=1